MRLADSLFTDYCLEKDIQWFIGYAEPGYTDKGKGVLVANWNEEERAGEIAEKLGYETEWSDEWTSCSDCNRLVRTQPSMYFWLPAYVTLGRSGTEDICKKCFEADWESYLLELLPAVENSRHRSLPDWVKEEWMQDLGYVRYGEEQETGLHRHQDDDPATVLKQLRPHYDSIVFQVASKDQFAVQWVTWVRKEQEVVGE